MVQGAAGRPAARRRGRHDHPHRRHDREPVLLAQHPAPVTVLAAPAGTAPQRSGETLLRRALTDRTGAWGLQVTIAHDALDHLIDVAGGDARIALTGLDAAALAAKQADVSEITLDIAADAVQHKAIVYDRQGDAHYDVISAFIKSIRGSDPDAALFWLARMLEAGEDARFIARRLIVHASEDVGLADPSRSSWRSRPPRRWSTSACPRRA